MCGGVDWVRVVDWLNVVECFVEGRFVVEYM